MNIANEKPVSNSTLVLREEFDDWAVLFDPSTGKALGLNPVGVIVWKCMDGMHTVDNIIEKLKMNCNAVPDDVKVDIVDFVKELIEIGYVRLRSDED